MGCGCGGKKTVQNVTNVTRNTVYQVLDTNRSVVSEHPTIQEARGKAVEIGGIVRVSSKTSEG